MARHLLSIRILFHVTFAFVYLPIIILAFTSGLHSNFRSDTSESYVQLHFDGMIALTALAGLGIFAALDILIISRKVNQRAFLAIEMVVAVLMPLSFWPIIVSCISVIWPDWFWTNFEQCTVATTTWFCAMIIYVIGIPLLQVPGIQQDALTSACVVAATCTILGLNAAYFAYICIAIITDKVHGILFLPTYLGESSLPRPGTWTKWSLFGTRRTPTERTAMVSHCADYVFRHSVFRKHAFEPAGWAIFRGIIAVYSCIGLVAFLVYDGYTELQLHSNLAYTVKETILPVTQCAPAAYSESTTSVTAFTTDLASSRLSEPTVVPAINPPPVLSPDGYYNNPVPGVWAQNFGLDQARGFNLRWTGNYSLVMWTTEANSVSFMNSTQIGLTSPLILAPFKQYDISLITTKYVLGSVSFISYRPDNIRIVDGGSASNRSVATFSFNNFCQPIIQRDLSPPSAMSSVGNVVSDIGGMLSFIDAVFALVFGRAIAAIIFGSRVISPFGLLGMVTRNRFKRLIHEQYPRMQDDVDRGGMAAYISEVAIDAALIDTPAVMGHTSSADSSSIGDTTGGEEPIELRHLQIGNIASYLQLSLVDEELGDLERNTLAGRQTDAE